MSEDLYFIFHSVTAAQHAWILLHRQGIDAELTRTPKRYSDAGCSNALKISRNESQRAAALLRGTAACPQRIILVKSGSAREVLL